MESPACGLIAPLRQFPKQPRQPGGIIRKLPVTRKIKLAQYCTPDGGYAISVTEAR